MSKMPTRMQISAGGVAFRRRGRRVEVALIAVGEQNRWQLPKGIVGRNESAEEAAVREVREEAGIDAEIVELIEKVEYWYVAGDAGARVRFHKFVYFYLMRYERGDVADHDAEVNEARWVEIGEAVDLLAFASERRVVEKVKGIIGKA